MIAKCYMGENILYVIHKTFTYIFTNSLHNKQPKIFPNMFWL